jgi:Protein of unknown function (DUF3616)
MVSVSWCSKRPERRLLGVFATAAILLAVASALADSEVSWPVKSKLKGRGDKPALNLSGIACDRTDFPRLCLVIDDESQNAQVVILRDGELMAGETIPLIHDSLDGKPLELDGEGVAFDDGFFYVTGSHGHPRDKKDKGSLDRDAARMAARIRASSQVIRVKIDPRAVTNKGDLTVKPEITRASRLRPVLLEDKILKSYVDKPAKDNGVSIEGVAIRGNRLYAGFRTPALENGSPVLSISLGALFAHDPPDPQLHVLRLGAGQGIRDLATDQNDFLVLAGPAIGKTGHFAIYRWNGAAAVTLLKDLPDFHDKDGNVIRPEAILPLDRTATGSRLLLLSDGPKEGAPHVIQLGE